MDIEDNYIRRALCERVVDGDTAIMVIDLGLDLRIHARVRFARINAPELSTDEGKLVASFVRTCLQQELLPLPGSPATWPIRVQTLNGGKRDEYGRLLAEVFYQQGGGWLNLSNILLIQGKAKHYGKQDPKP